MQRMCNKTSAYVMNGCMPRPSIPSPALVSNPVVCNATHQNNPSYCTRSSPAFSTAMPVGKSASPSPPASLALHHQHLTPRSSPYAAQFSPLVTPARSPPDLTPDWSPASPRASPSPVTINAEADLEDTIRKHFCNDSSRECPLLIQVPNTARFILECDAYLTRTKHRYELAHRIVPAGLSWQH